MKKIKITIIAVAAVAMVFFGAHDVLARGGGGGHMGGGGGGGWHGGGGGGGEHGGGGGGHGQGGHRHNNNNNYYYGGGGWGYGFDDEAVVNVDLDTDSRPSTVVVEQPTTEVVQQPVPTADAPVGAQVTMLPSGAEGRIIGGAQFYISGNTWYKPYFGASGVYYEVVSPPNT
ncbi:MAG: hypothetical protein WCI77_07420 [Candidatus Omnitrophota bacterium]